MTDVLPKFQRDEFVERVTRLQQAMRARQLDVMLIDDIEILAYFTGWERSISFYRACLVPVSGTPVMVLRSLDIDPFREKAWFDTCVGYSDVSDPVRVVADEVLKLASGKSVRIGVDTGSHGMTVEVFGRLQAALAQAEFVPVPGLPWELRLIKSATEIKHMERAAGVADQVTAEIAALARPGLSGRDLAAHVARRYIELGADTGNLGPITYGKGWGFLHGHLPGEPLTKGDILHLELVPRYRGYSARIMRSVVMGEPSAAQLHAAKTMGELQDAQIVAMKPGARANEVDAILREGMLRTGLRDSYENITGYTLGYYSQQPIRSSDFTRVFGPRETWVLEAGMTFHMYTSAQGLAYSETVLVDHNGPRRLTQLVRKLFSCDC